MVGVRERHPHVPAGTGALAPFRHLVPALLLLVLPACGAPAPAPEAEIYTDANTEFESGDFTMAALHYDELLEQHPFSDLAEIARLRIAHAYYLGGQYEKAVAAFNDFERLHPTSPQLPFVEYTIGMAYLDQAAPLDRGKSASENARRQFGRVRDRYPDSLYGRLAGFRIAECDELLAGHEIVIGDYYLDTGDKEAALTRYRFVVETYPDSDASVEAMRRLRAQNASIARSDTAPVPSKPVPYSTKFFLKDSSTE
jgi:outer membrane protein assembly factor BamD